MINEMRVTKRNGDLQDMFFDKILTRVKKLGKEANIQINYSALVIKIIDQLYDTISTTKIDELTAEQCAMSSTQHPDYNVLAGWILISNHQKNTEPSFSYIMESLYNFTDVNGNHAPLISKESWDIVHLNKDLLDSMIDHSRDYLIDYFGFKTLERAYLFKIRNTVIERPQHMWLRVALGIHGNDMTAIKETYDLMSLKYFTHATPTLFNACTPKPQMSSCYLIQMEQDSVDGIYDTLKDCAQISKYSGGIGLHIHNIRSTGSHINGTNGKTNGLVPMLKVFNSTAKFINQGGKRNGSFAIYLEMWHPDIQDFLDLKKNHGDEEMRARDLFYALWVCDLFMQRVHSNEIWSLFCPRECPGLDNVYGEDFVKLYEKYEFEHKYKKRINARDLWLQILDSQMETGTPYILYKDAINIKSNQQNIGVIKSSNLCSEITEYSDENETAVCNLASIALPSFVNKETKTFDYDKLHMVSQTITNNLNKIIDVNFYPTDKTRVSNLRHRPIGIGVQGLADTFILMDLSFYCDEAKQINIKIFETIYHAALTRSNNLAIKEGAYSTFQGSPASQGILQYDMWGVTPSDRYDWSALKESIKTHGLRNSLLVALMPTASTSQILGYNECFEPLTSNIYSRRTLAGEFIMANKYLMRELIDLGLWNDQIKNNIIENKGSIQHIDIIPQHIRNKYKIVWEIPMKHIIDMSADRGAYVCQSQSLNLWVEDPNYNTLTSMHFYAWKKGLKTGIYYLRRKAKHQAQQFTIEPKKNNTTNNTNNTENNDICEMCSA
jgi:ribonucleoside-diphosphate reductase alpha chain